MHTVYLVTFAPSLRLIIGLFTFPSVFVFCHFCSVFRAYECVSPNNTKAMKVSSMLHPTESIKLLSVRWWSQFEKQFLLDYFPLLYLLHREQ